MSKFPDPLCVAVHNSGRLFQLTADFSFHYDGPDGLEIYTVPKGFVTNFASIPKILWSVYGPIGTATKASVIHDYLYSNASVSRLKADQIFRDGIVTVDGKKTKANVFYRAVRTFGAGQYDGMPPEPFIENENKSDRLV